ncbi:MAG: hypothetical protein IKI11_08585 [Neisseriaceae bacterium]|nr:hypothetical protein [Neisseriaceae bacterium]
MRDCVRRDFITARNDSNFFRQPETVAQNTFSCYILSLFSGSLKNMIGANQYDSKRNIQNSWFYALFNCGFFKCLRGFSP